MLTLGDNFSYQGAKPLDARLKYATLAAMKAVADATMYDGCMAYCVATDKTYQWKSTNTVDADTGKWREFSSGSGDAIQVDTLPTAGADELGNVYQYIGSTTSTLTHGYFYECVSDGESTPTYSWSQVEVSKGGHDIKNNGVAVTARDTMNFTDFDIADDSTNEETDIKVHRLTQAEMTEIMSTLPGVPTELPVLFDLTGAEHVVGWYKLANGTKKPVYEKTFIITIKDSIGDTSLANALPTGVDTVIDLRAVHQTSDGGAGIINYTNLPSTTVGTEVAGLAIWVVKSTGVATIRCNYASYFGRDVHITVRYTKTTDTPV